MFERGEKVVRISGGPPLTIVSIAADGRGRRTALCEGQDEFGRLSVFRLPEQELALYFPPPGSRPKRDPAT